MIERSLYNQIFSALSRQAAVALIGPRQVGKTTLALQIAAQTQSLYMDLEDPIEREKLANPLDRKVISLFFHRLIYQANFFGWVNQFRIIERKLQRPFGIKRNMANISGGCDNSQGGMKGQSPFGYMKP